MAMGSVVLSGFMAVGKSTVGARLASRLGLPFVDTDAVLAEEAGMPVPTLWTTHGETEFRAREGALVQRLFADATARVIAFGGGTATVRQARHLALEEAFVVTLTASPPTVVERVSDLAGRPNLKVGGDPRARAAELMEARRDAYAECHLTLSTDGRDPDDVVDTIVAALARKPLAVPLGTRSYVVDVTRDSPALLTDALARLAPSALVVVTDAHVQRHRGAALRAALKPLAVEPIWVTLPAGEEHKTLAAAATVWDAALGHGIDREAVVVAFGGGVVGDIAGFAASALLRGVRVVQVPTTVLAMVDASVGGKTGVDHAGGKNLVGTFHQPSAVVADVAHLATLPPRDRNAGLAEVVKIALLCDPGLLELVESRARDLAGGDPEVLAAVIRRAVAAKVRIVRDDEREAGVRALLNLGHTVGHALEAYGGYTRWRHGEAVSIGTVVELGAGHAMGRTPGDVVVRAGGLLQRLGLPVDVSRAELLASWPLVASDKKCSRGAGNRAETIAFPVVTALGAAHVERVALSDLRTHCFT